MDQFWQIAEQLRRDSMPSETEWTELFDTPAYRYLVDVEGKASLFREYFPLAFMPSRRIERDSVAAAGADRYLSHYIQVAERQDELLVFQQELRNRQLMSNALEQTEEFLPTGMIERHDDPPPVAFAIFEPDGKANEDIVVVDLYFATQINLTPFLAHEAHHYYKAHLNRLRRPEPESSDYPLIRSLAQLQTEGIADLIDKRSILETSNVIEEVDAWYARNYKMHVRNAPSTFARMDSLIQAIAGDPSKAREYGDAVWSMLPFGAHPHGGYMALIIEKGLGREGLIDTLDNPFAFLRAYNRAARTTDEAHVFSENAMAYLHLLETRYVR